MVDPEKASHVVRDRAPGRRQAGWTPIGTDSTSPAYTAFDSLAPLGLAAGHAGEVPGGPAGGRRSDGGQRRAHGPVGRQHAGHDGDAALLPAGRRLQRRDAAVLGSAHVGRRGRPGGAGPDRLGEAVAARPGSRRLGRVRHPAGGRHQAGELHHAPAQRGHACRRRGSPAATGRSSRSVSIPGQPTARRSARPDSATDGRTNPGDWDPACAQAQLQLDADDEIWKAHPARRAQGDYAFKAAINRSWDENYGLGGVAAAPTSATRRRRPGDVLLRPPDALGRPTT